MSEEEMDLHRFNETGELPPAWEDQAEFDRRVDEMNRELDAMLTGCLDDDDPRHPRHPVTCPRACCRPAGWEP